MTLSAAAVLPHITIHHRLESFLAFRLRPGLSLHFIFHFRRLNAMNDGTCAIFCSAPLLITMSPVPVKLQVSESEAIPAGTATVVPFLAQELLYLILDNVSDRSTLRACCLAHSSLRSYAQERLFTTLQVDATPEENNLRALRDCFVKTQLARHVRSVEVTGYDEVPFSATSLLGEVFWLLSAAGRTFGGDAPERGLLPGPGLTSVTSLDLCDLRVSDSELLGIIHSFPKLEKLHFHVCRLHDSGGEGVDGNQSAHPTRTRTPGSTTPCLKDISFVFTSPSDYLLRTLFPSETGIALRSMSFNYAQISHSTIQSLVTRAGPLLEKFAFEWASFGQAWEVSGESTGLLSIYTSRVGSQFRVFVCEQSKPPSISVQTRHYSH